MTDRLAALLDRLDAFFRAAAPLGAGEAVVVAFSGGPDSTALLWGMARLAARRSARLFAAHLDHALDPGSAGRAAAAGRTAAALGVALFTARRPVAAARRTGESLEEAGRRVRYGFLEEVRRAAGARWVATAHHRDDQAETVLLRLAQGSGVEGLAGVRPVHGRVVRPLLGAAREELLRAVAAAGLEAADDPGNRDLGPARNRIRHLLLPALAARDPELPALLGRVAGRAHAAREALERRLAPLLAARQATGGVAVPAAAFLGLPGELQPLALAALHRRAGAPYPPGAAARAELLRQLARAAGGGRRVGCDAGGGWRWERRGDLLVLLSPAVQREQPEPGA